MYKRNGENGTISFETLPFRLFFRWRYNKIRCVQNYSHACKKNQTLAFNDDNISIKNGVFICMWESVSRLDKNFKKILSEYIFFCDE